MTVNRIPAHNPDGTAIPERVRSWFMAKDKTTEELPWARPDELDGDTLARPVVLVNGSFDVLHSGHMKLLFAARRKARTLVVAMDSDARVKALKGAHRPIQTWPERATTLQYMPVDWVVEIGDDGDFLTLVKRVRPDLRVQGADYFGRPSRIPEVRTMFVRGTGMRTSFIEARILERAAAQGFGELE